MKELMLEPVEGLTGRDLAHADAKTSRGQLGVLIFCLRGGVVPIKIDTTDHP